MAQQMNNKATVEVENNICRIINHEDMIKYSAEKSARLSSNYTSTQSQKYSTTTFEASQSYPEEDRPLVPSQGRYTNYSAYNPPERKQVKLFGVKSRKHDKANYSGNQDIHSSLLSDQQNLIILQNKNEQKDFEMRQSDPIYQDDREIRKSLDIEVLMQKENKHNTPKGNTKTRTNPHIFKNINNKSEKGTQKVYRKQKSQTSLHQKDKNKIKKNPQSSNFLKKRSKMGYDPMKAIHEENNKRFNDAKSVTSASRLKYVKARTDSGLRACVSSKARIEFRKTTGDSSQIIHK